MLCDRSGTIEKDELLELGRARQTTGQKSRVWTEEKNTRFMAKLDEDGNGTIDFEVSHGRDRELLRAASVSTV